MIISILYVAIYFYWSVPSSLTLSNGKLLRELKIKTKKPIRDEFIYEFEFVAS